MIMTREKLLFRIRAISFLGVILVFSGIAAFPVYAGYIRVFPGSMYYLIAHLE